MKNIIITILLCCVSASAQIVLTGNSSLTGLAGAHPFPAAGGGGADVTENFEGTGYENSWTEANGAPDEDTATTGLSLEASQCLYVTAEAGAENCYVSFTASDNAYAYFLMRIENAPTGAGRTQFGFTSVVQAMEIGPLAFKIYSNGEDVSDLGNGTLSADTTYHVWFEYEKGTGANGKLRVYYSTDGTKPGTPDAEITTSNDTHQVSTFEFGVDWTGTGGDIYYDKLRISRTTAFGSNPS